MGLLHLPTLVVHLPWREGPAASLATLPATSMSTELSKKKEGARSSTSDLQVPLADKMLWGVNPLVEETGWVCAEHGALAGSGTFSFFQLHYTYSFSPEILKTSMGS